LIRQLRIFLMKMKNVLISLGSNLGNREANLKIALHALELKLGPIEKKSSVYETKPWGKSDQPNFLNQVIQVNTDVQPEDCLTELLAIEIEMGRQRNEKWGARTIDLDLLYADGSIVSKATLSLPHPGIALRRFVLVPLVEIAPDFIHPILKKNHRQLLDECGDNLEVNRLQT
jgi:2-amino-4-hydroxy-6-hydroxymethyldihydropteridine diphosphokinase